MVTKKLMHASMNLAKTLAFVFLVMTVVGCSSSSDTTVGEDELAEADLFDGLKEEAGVSGTADPYSLEYSNDKDADASAKDKAYADDNIVSGAASSADGAAMQTTGDGFGYYYSAIGGESVRQVALALYSKSSAYKKLLQMNAGLSVTSPIPADTKVYFDMETVSPRAEMLTTDVLKRYRGELSNKLAAKRQQQFGNEEFKETTVGPGDTLQVISQRIYGTTRLWTELFLLNQDRIKDYDNLRVGTVLKYYPETDYKPVVLSNNEAVTPPSDAIAAANDFSPAADEAPTNSEMMAEVPKSAPSVVQPATPVTKTVADETPVAPEKDIFAEEKEPEPKPAKLIKATPDSPAPSGGRSGVVSGGIPVDTKSESLAPGVRNGEAERDSMGGTVAEQANQNGFGSNAFAKKPPKVLRPQQAESEEQGFFATNLRRIIYLGLILFILIGGYFLTKPGRGFKKSKFTGIQPMPTQSPLPQARPRAAPSPRARGAGGAPSAPPRPNQRTGS